jgi:serine/threonine protein kinase
MNKGRVKSDARSPRLLSRHLWSATRRNRCTLSSPGPLKMVCSVLRPSIFFGCLPGLFQPEMCPSCLVNFMHSLITLAINLLEVLLQFEPNRRLSASEAITHPYFTNGPIDLASGSTSMSSMTAQLALPAHVAQRASQASAVVQAQHLQAQQTAHAQAVAANQYASQQAIMHQQQQQAQQQHQYMIQARQQQQGQGGYYGRSGSKGEHTA